MKYIFDDHSHSQLGRNPIESFQICWYDMNKDGYCYEEDWCGPDHFCKTDIAYLDTDENEGCSDRIRMFVHHENGSIYELRLHKITDEAYEECHDFYGGRNYID